MSTARALHEILMNALPDYKITPLVQRTRLEIGGLAQDTEEEDIRVALDQFSTTTENF